jgi:sulfopyruvate decarboxylase subunit alpha
MQPRLAALVLEGLKKAHVQVMAALPDSLLKGVYEAAAKDPDIRYIPVTNEAEGAAVAAGSWAGGKRSVLVMENSGLRVACEALARLGLVNALPVTMLMGFRGDVGERIHWGINHGITMEPVLQALRIPYLMIDREEDIVTHVVRSVVHAASTNYHTALIFRSPLVGGRDE